MKKIAGYLFFVAILISLTTHIACDGDNGGPKLTAQQEQAKLINGTWSTSAVVSKPADVPESEVSDLSFTFGVDSDNNPTTFSASGTNVASYFAGTSATWSFAGSSTTSIQLSGVTPVTSINIVGDVTATSMTISFTLTTARVAILDGDYTLTLTK